MQRKFIVLLVGFSMMFVSCSSGFTVGGDAMGVSGKIELKLTSYTPKEVVQVLTITSNGDFRFPNALDPGASYSISANTDPLEQSCSVVNPNPSTLTARVTNIQVKCSPRHYDMTR